MLIALPNRDFTWTLTLFMPHEKFQMLDESEKVIKFFQENFPDIVPYIGSENLKKDFFIDKPNSLITIKCDKFHYRKALLIGDAAHALVPFYGQGS